MNEMGPRMTRCRPSDRSTYLDLRRAIGPTHRLNKTSDIDPNQRYLTGFAVKIDQKDRISRKKLIFRARSTSKNQHLVQKIQHLVSKTQHFARFIFKNSTFFWTYFEPDQPPLTSTKQYQDHL